MIEASESGERDFLGEKANEKICIYTTFFYFIQAQTHFYICICIKVREARESLPTRNESGEREFQGERQITAVCYEL